MVLAGSNALPHISLARLGCLFTCNGGQSDAFPRDPWDSQLLAVLHPESDGGAGSGVHVNRLFYMYLPGLKLSCRFIVGRLPGIFSYDGIRFQNNGS